MSKPDRDIEAKAMNLPSKERARLAERLIASLEGEPEIETDAQWLEESERRLAQIETGQVAGIPASEVLGRSRSALR
ncbi:MAG: addiction module antitoxin RelB [Proteobacteria bacterium]|nr:MAG: addiction module antitoxin RelB [Pseudomonadota bacterium]